jgi:hypothetical protein
MWILYTTTDCEDFFAGTKVQRDIKGAEMEAFEGADNSWDTTKMLVNNINNESNDLSKAHKYYERIALDKLGNTRSVHWGLWPMSE